MQQPVFNAALVLEAPRRITDSGGGIEIVWGPIGRIWAELRSVSAREIEAGGRQTSRVTHRVTLRAAPVASPRRPSTDCRFRMGKRIFAIRGVAEAEGRNQYLTCWVEEGPFA